LAPPGLTVDGFTGESIEIYVFGVNICSQRPAAA
jgi:hypothetical protein